MQYFNGIINNMEKCFYILSAVMKEHTENQKILIFAFGAASYSCKSLVNIYNSIIRKYLKKHIILYCFDCGFEDETILLKTSKDLYEVNFVETYVDEDKNIKLFEKKNFNIILSNLKMPMNLELTLSTQYLTNCIKQNKLNNFFDYMLSSKENYNIQFQEFLTQLIEFVDPEETIFMNDLFFNSWGYYYYDSQTNNLKFISSMPFEIEKTHTFEKVAQDLKIKLPEKGDRIIRSIYDTNVFFSQMIWVIKIMEDLYKTKKITIMEHGQHTYTDRDYVYLPYKKNICL